MRSSSCLTLLALTALAASAADLSINFPNDSPVVLLSDNRDGSSETARGGAMLLDLHAALSLKNVTQRRIRGITLVVTAQEVTPGGKASVTLTNLDVAPSDTFPVRVDLRLLRPLQASSDVPVRIGLDGVLFDDLGFYGPDKLSSRRTMALAEWEARRDRKYFKSLLAEGGAERLRQEMIESLAHQADRPSLDVQVMRGGRATNLEPEKQLQFAFLQIPDSPVEPMEGMARIAGNEARAPRLEVKNRSDRSIRYLEMGWILHDRTGREFLAGSVPAELNLGARAVEQNSGKRDAEVSATRLAAAGHRVHDRLHFKRGVFRWRRVDSDARRSGHSGIAPRGGAFGRRAAPGADLSQEGAASAGGGVEPVLRPRATAAPTSPRPGYPESMTKLFVVSLSAVSLSAVSLGAIALASAQQTDPSNKPHVFLENRSKPGKPSTLRVIDGTVKDQKDSPIRGAVVQLKDMKTSKVVDFLTKDDGRFAFRDLPMDVNFELTAKHGAIISPVKKVTPYDSRHEVVLTFRLEPAEESKAAAKDSKQQKP